MTMKKRTGKNGLFKIREIKLNNNVQKPTQQRI